MKLDRVRMTEKKIPNAERHQISELNSRPLRPSQAEKIKVARKPSWIRIRPPAGDNYQNLKKIFRERNLHTVCEEAHCPNVSECWAGGTATLMLGGDICTRACRFCAVKTARRPPELDLKEPVHVAESISDLGLKYVVLTSVDRDDLEDGGAGHFGRTIEEIKKRDSEILIEALVPDFRGRAESIHRVVDSGLDVYAHNIETVERLHSRVRDPRASYFQSLETLREAKQDAFRKGRTLYTKSSIMLGLGETAEELEKAFEDLRSYDVDVLTLGQYLRPSLQHLPVEKFLKPEEFEELKILAQTKGFLYVASGPMVRSSYRAGEFFMEAMIRENRANSANQKRGKDHAI